MTPAPISEAAWQRQVIALAHAAGWETMHVRRSRSAHFTATSRSGWPDLCLWRPGRFLVAELKTDAGKLRPEQTEVLDELVAAGLEVHVWRPADLPEVVAVLRGKNRLLDAWQGR